MTPEIAVFIKNHKDLINQNTKESWNILYDSLCLFVVPNNKLIGEFSSTMLKVKIDPPQILGQIPNYYLYGSNIENYNIPIEVTSIGHNSFRYCKDLKSIYIPDSVISIGTTAFDHCSNLSSVSLPNQIENFGAAAFWNCQMLEQIIYRGTIDEAKEKFFQNAQRRPEFIFGSNVKKLICTDGELIIRK